MNPLHELITNLCDAGKHPPRTIAAAMKQSGKPAVGLFPLFLSEELVYAAGYLPVGLWGGEDRFQLADKYLQSFACTIIRGNMELTMQGKYDFLRAILVPSQCDTLKCVCENMKVALHAVPILGVTIPHNRTIPAAMTQMLAEFDYLQEELAHLDKTGAKPCSLDEAFTVYEDWRAVMRDFIATAPNYLNTITPAVRHYLIKAAWFMDKADYTAQMRELLEALKAQPQETFTGTKLITTGIMIDAPNVLDLFADLGIAVADDMLCHESLQFRGESRTEGTTAEKIAGRLLDLQAASPLYEPGKPRGQLLAALAKQHGAAAVLFCLTKFCDPEAFDQPLVKQDLLDAGIPMLSIEIDQHVDSLGQLRTRIEGFLETAI